jgi:Domain of unknown function (DUF6798)
MKSVATASICLALALLTFFQFPGHTWLQQDTQIYVPVLEHEHDPSLLRNDLLVQQSNVAYTLYDEAALALHAITPLDFRQVLAIQQVATRALGIWGVYLMATALDLSIGAAWLLAMIVSLGASVAGPAVLTFEYEPTPRAFALPLVVCAIGLTAHRRYLAAGIAASCAFLYHPPTTISFWLLFILVIVHAGKPPACALIPFGVAVAVLLLAAHSPPLGFFEKVTPLEEQLQRIRTAYVWISTWPNEVIWHYPIVFAILIAAAIRVRRIVPELGIFAIGLPILGLLTMPVSWLLLEHAKWAFVPQFQPMRKLLFVVLMAQFLTAAAGAFAVAGKRWVEAAAWFAVAYLIPLPLEWRAVMVAIVLGMLAVLAVRRAPVLGLAAFFAIPMLAGVANYPHLHTPALDQLSQWARISTPRDAIFLFPDAGRGLAPGIFRSEAERAVYVDWKGGGQINYLRDFAELWWFRWQQTVGAGFAPVDMPKYSALGIQYVVIQPQNRLPQPAAFENSSYLVYRLQP